MPRDAEMSSDIHTRLNPGQADTPRGVLIT